MKLSVLDRILLTLLCIFSMAISVFCVLFVLRVVPFDALSQSFQAVYDDAIYGIGVVAVALLLFVLCLKLLIGGGESKGPRSALVKKTENGAIRISVGALDSMVQKHARANGDVRDIKSGIELDEDGIRIRIRLMLMPESNIPETSAVLQTSLKDYVETLSGIQVKEISIFVEDLGLAANKPRVD